MSMWYLPFVQNVSIKFDGACSSAGFIPSCGCLWASQCRFATCNWYTIGYVIEKLSISKWTSSNSTAFCQTGSVDKGVVEVTNCFCVPHKEHADQVEAELSYALDVYELNRRVNSAENIVGEYWIVQNLPFIGDGVCKKCAHVSELNRCLCW